MKEHIQKAYEFVSRIPVTGENVDLMAAVRHELRVAYREAEREEAEKEQKDAKGVNVQGGEENG